MNCAQTWTVGPSLIISYQFLHRLKALIWAYFIQRATWLDYQYHRGEFHAKWKWSLCQLFARVRQSNRKKEEHKGGTVEKKKSFFLQKWCFTDVGMRTAWRLYDSHANTMNRSVCHRFSTNRTSSFVVCVYNDTVSYAVQIHVCVLTNVQYLSTIVTSPMKTHFTI